MTKPTDYSNPAWIASMIAWHENEARHQLAIGGPTRDGYADMHQTSAQMLRALCPEAASRTPPLRPDDNPFPDPRTEGERSPE